LKRGINFSKIEKEEIKTVKGEKKMFDRLKKGDVIGVVSPSSAVDEDDLEPINQSVLLMEAAGFHIRFGKNVFKNTLGYGATPQEKAEDINQMYADKEVKAIFCLSGGFNSNSIFEYLDYDLIKNNAKPLCGFSDSTSIENVIYARSGVITFNGPTFKSLTTWATEYGYKEVIKRFVEGSLDFGEPDDEYLTIKKGIAEGRLVGGNLSLTSQMCSRKLCY